MKNATELINSHIFEVNFMQYEQWYMDKNEHAAFRSLLQLSPLVHKNLRAALKFKSVKKYPQLSRNTSYADIQKLAYANPATYELPPVDESQLIELDGMFHYIYDLFAEFPLVCFVTKCDQSDLSAVLGNIQKRALYTRWFEIMTGYVRLFKGDVFSKIKWGVYDPVVIKEALPLVPPAPRAIDVYNAGRIKELRQ